MTAGSHQDLLTHGRKHLLPYFASLRLSEIDEESVRDWLATMARQVEKGELSAKTVNNARTCLSVALNEAARRGLVTRRAGEREFPAPQRLRRSANAESLDALAVAVSRGPAPLSAELSDQPDVGPQARLLEEPVTGVHEDARAAAQHAAQQGEPARRRAGAMVVECRDADARREVEERLVLRRTRLTISTSRLSARYSAACMTARIVPPMPHALASRIVTLSPAGSRACARNWRSSIRRTRRLSHRPPPAPESGALAAHGRETSRDRRRVGAPRSQGATYTKRW